MTVVCSRAAAAACAVSAARRRRAPRSAAVGAARPRSRRTSKACDARVRPVLTRVRSPRHAGPAADGRPAPPPRGHARRPGEPGWPRSPTCAGGWTRSRRRTSRTRSAPAGRGRASGAALGLTRQAAHARHARQARRRGGRPRGGRPRPDGGQARSARGVGAGRGGGRPGAPPPRPARRARRARSRRRSPPPGSRATGCASGSRPPGASPRRRAERRAPDPRRRWSSRCARRSRAATTGWTWSTSCSPSCASRPRSRC